MTRGATFLFLMAFRFRQTSWNTSASNFNVSASHAGTASIQLPTNRVANNPLRSVAGYGAASAVNPASGSLSGALPQPAASVSGYAVPSNGANAAGGYGSFGGHSLGSNFGGSGGSASYASGYGGSTKEKGIGSSRFGRLAQFGVMGGASSTTGTILSSNSSSAASNYRGFGANNNPLGTGFGRHKY